MSKRSGVAALVGKPNAGKSTLVNKIVGNPLCIVTPKPHTTRNVIRGILTEPTGQLVLVDTPGWSTERSALGKAMRGAIDMAGDGADVVLWVVDVGKGDPHVDATLKTWVLESKLPIVVALNKIDRVQPKQALLPWIATYAEFADEVVPISAKSGDGLEHLKSCLVERLPEGEPLFPTDAYTDQSEVQIAAELVRQQILLQIQQEIPHGAAVKIEQFEDERDAKGEGLVRIEGRIYVERDGHKGILVGKGGRTIKSLNTAARERIEALLGCKVFLQIQVAVDPNWTKNQESLREYGLIGEAE